MQGIIIDEEFQRLFPMLTEQQFCNLENSILEHGCMNPLVLWNGILIDGHNRYNIVTKHNLPFNTISLEFNSRDEVIAWMIKVQIDRRNLTPMELTYYRGMHYNIEKKLHGGDRQSEEFSRGQNVLLNGNTASKLSEQYNVTSRTIKRDGQIANVIIAIGKESENAKRDILSGAVKINRRQLREIAADSDADIVSLASKIEEGVFEGKQTPATTGSFENSIGNLPKVEFADVKKRELTIEKVFNSWITKDIVTFYESFADDVIYFESWGPAYRGIEHIKAWFKDWNKENTVLEWTIKEFYHTENTCICEWLFKCECGGNIDGFTGVSIISFNEMDKITVLKEFQSKTPNFFP